MKERPILFNSEMVRAVLDGRKTQTRRVIKPRPNDNQIFVADYGDGNKLYLDNNPPEEIKCPYGKVGDRLWARETFCVQGVSRTNFALWGEYADGKQYEKRLSLDEEQKYKKWKKPFGRKPSLFMFRSLSRITLEITTIRVERVQDITGDDAVAEGITGEICHHGHIDVCTAGCGVGPKYNFMRLWDSINAERKVKDGDGKVVVVEDYSWKNNPYVWVVEFEVVT